MVDKDKAGEVVEIPINASFPKRSIVSLPLKHYKRQTRVGRNALGPEQA